MLNKKLKYILGISLIILLIGLVAGGKLFWEKTKLKKSPASRHSEIFGIIKSLGSEDEFSLEKDGKIVFQNKATDLPKIKYRIVSRYKITATSWGDLRESDSAILEIYYNNRGQIESRILKIYRIEEQPTE